MTRFDDIDLVDVPNQWDEIVQRAEVGDLPMAEPSTSHRSRWRIAAVAATVLAVGLVAAVTLHRTADRTDVATQPDVTVTAPTVPDTTAVAPSGDEAQVGSDPILACTGGELLAGSIPADAVAGGDPIFDLEPFEGRPTLSWSWRNDDLDVQLVVPGIPWVDFVGERTERLVDPPGTLAYMWDDSGERPTVNAIIETGLPAPCARSEVIVAGGTEAERVAAATDAARALSWRSLASSPSPEDVVDESTVRQWSLDYAAGMLAPGAHAVEISITSYVADGPIGRMVGPPTGPEPAWSVILRTAPGSLVMPGDPEQLGRELLLINFGSESKQWMASVSASFPAEQAMRDRENPVPALIIGAAGAIDDHERVPELQEELARRERERAQEQRELAEEWLEEEQAE